MPENPAEKYQLQAFQIGLKVRTDPGFVSAIKANPVSALRAAGLDSDSIREMLTEDAYFRGRVDFSEVADCTAVSGCACSECCISCWFGSGNGRRFGVDDV